MFTYVVYNNIVCTVYIHSTIAIFLRTKLRNANFVFLN